MSEELSDPQQISRPSQYPNATRVENGVAYDISGKSLGKVDEPQETDPLAKLGGIPADAPKPAAAAKDPLAALGGIPADPNAGVVTDPTQRALNAQAAERRANPPGMLPKAWDWFNAGLVNRETVVRAMTGSTPQQINEALNGPYEGEKEITDTPLGLAISSALAANGIHLPSHAAYREFMRGAVQDTAGVGSSLTSPLSVATIGAGEVSAAAGATTRAATALRAAKNAESAVTAADAALAARTTEVARAAQQANEARLAAEAAEAAEKAGQGWLC